MEITNSKINDYIKEQHIQSPVKRMFDAILTEMEAYARENEFPIIGPMVGPFLQQIATIMDARNVVELGSGFGYSALWLAAGMPQDGRIICTDTSEEYRDMAVKYFKEANLESMLDFRVGDALEIIKEIDIPIDIIYNDVDKHGYPEAFDLSVPKLRKGGIFITDNVLWSGRILEDDPNESTRGVAEFNRKMFATERIVSSIIPIRDGLGIIVKQ
ncbi:MAG: O-methyltransferase [candidate division Zixibacteria bacterium]|nr:O-methyltransferase [candidate division Zixibacteria bacterium]